MAEFEWPEDMPRMGQLLEEASLWFARMRGPDAESFRPEFEHWLSLGATHRGAYNHAGEIFAMGRFLAAEKAAAQAKANDNEANRWRWAALAASILLIVAAGAWFTTKGREQTPGTPVDVAANLAKGAIEQKRYGSNKGEQQELKLADGSVVKLEPDSELVTHFSDAKREMKLMRGRARFDVAHESRPFVVLAGGGSVTARGTVFDVILGTDKRVTVRLLRGAVDVERPVTDKGTGSSAAVARLEPGEILSFASITPTALNKAAGNSEIQPVAVPPELSLVREYERTPLSAVIAEANKGSATLIRIADPGIGALRVSGRFRVNDPDQVAERLAVLFDLEAERTKPGEITLRHR